MKISELASRTGVSADRLRHYEELGLIKANRNSAGYRIFQDDTVREVKFIAKCREVGVSIPQIGDLIPGYRAGTLTYDEMIELMINQIAQVDQQISELRKLRDELSSASKWFESKKNSYAIQKTREPVDLKQSARKMENAQ